MHSPRSWRLTELDHKISYPSAHTHTQHNTHMHSSQSWHLVEFDHKMCHPSTHTHTHTHTHSTTHIFTSCDIYIHRSCFTRPNSTASNIHILKHTQTHSHTLTNIQTYAQVMLYYLLHLAELYRFRYPLLLPVLALLALIAALSIVSALFVHPKRKLH